MILDAAIGFFAEAGFDAQLRELASRIGISQSLIFRYFGSKQVLIERVYERVYVARWSSQWAQDIGDRRQDLRDRLIGFYRSYLTAIEGYEWIRMTLYSGLAGNDLTRRYIETRVDGLLLAITKEITHEIPAARQIAPEVLHELVWHLHATFIYYLIRKYVFQVATIADTGLLIEATVTHFLAGLEAGIPTAPSASASTGATVVKVRRAAGGRGSSKRKPSS